MHNGSLRTLDDVLEAYNKADRTVATELPNFYLDAQQKQALIAFLESLTDYSFISNLDLSEPR
jgi:cytochrome c peroxidase